MLGLKLNRVSKRGQRYGWVITPHTILICQYKGSQMSLCWSIILINQNLQFWRFCFWNTAFQGIIVIKKSNLQDKLTVTEKENWLCFLFVLFSYIEINVDSFGQSKSSQESPSRIFMISYQSHQGWVTAYESVNWAIIGSDNALSHQAIIWTNAGLLIVPLRANSIEILSTFSLKNLIWKCCLKNGSHFVSDSMRSMVSIIVFLMKLPTSATALLVINWGNTIWGQSYCLKSSITCYDTIAVDNIY